MCHVVVICGQSSDEKEAGPWILGRGLEHLPTEQQSRLDDVA